MRLVRRLSLLVAVVSALVTADPAAAQFALGGDPRVNPNDFRVTTFASGLNFPTGMAQLSDGSILIATNNPTGVFFNSSGALLRFVDADGDGVADGPGQVMYTDPVGVWTDLRVAGNLVFVTSAADKKDRITILRMNNGPASPYAKMGELDFTFPTGWEHKSYALEARPAPGGPANAFELYFNVGSDANFGQSSATASVSGPITSSLQGGSIYRVLVTDNGTSVAVSNLTLIAVGLRNAAGIKFHPTNGDLYFEDNGIDGITQPTVEDAFSADEINRIAAADLGVVNPVPDFGFPNDYIEYRTGRRVGSGGIQPLVAFQPIPMPNGSESEGPSRIAFAPPGFPSYVNNGIFVGFHGQFGKPTDQNEENPVVFWDLGTGQYFHFVESFQLGHPDFFLTTSDSLFIGDMSSNGLLTAGSTGAIYQVKRATAGSQLSAWFTNPMPGTPLSGSVSVGMAESNGTGTITWTVTVDGAQIFTTSGTPTTASFSWNANSVSFGNHTLGLTVRDGSGATATATRTVKVVAPLTASITSPTEGATVSGVVTVNMVETGDYNSPITFNLSVDGTQVFTTTGTPNSAAFDWNSAGVPGGPHTLVLLVRDGVGRTATATRHVATPGGGQFTASIDSPAEGATVSGTVPVNMSETNGTGTISWTVRLDGGATPIFSTSNAGPTASFSWNTAGVTPGAHHLDLTAQDGAGHTSTVTRNVVVSSGTIGVAITQPGTDGATVKGTSWFVLWVSGAATGTKTYTLTANGVTIGSTTDTSSGPISIPADTTKVNDGSTPVVATVRDPAGNSGNATRVVNIQNGQLPFTASITSPTEGATVSGTVPVNMSESNGTGTITWTLRLDGGATPIFTTSNAGPTASFSWNTSGVTPGAHALSLSAQDGSGRIAPTVTRNVTVASAGPGAFFTSPADGATVAGNVTIGMGRDTTTGTVKWTLNIDGTQAFTVTNTATTATFNWDTGPVAPGPHTLSLTVQDTASGATSTATPRNVTVAGPLGASITTPAEGATVSSTVTVGMSESNGVGTISWTLRLDGGSTPIFSTSNTGPTASFSWNTATVPDGAHTLTLTVQDGAGRTATATRSVTVQQPPLTASITTPAEGATVNSTVTVGMSESNGIGSISWALRLDGGTTPIFSTSNPGPTASFSWDTSGVTRGAHTLTLTVQDGGGRTATVTRNVTVADPPPLTASIDTPTEGLTVSGPIVVGLSETNGTGTISWTVRLDGGATPIFSTSNPGPSASFTWDTSTVTPGAHRLDLTVQDGGGRTATATRNVTVQSIGTIKVFITQPGTDGTTITAGSTVWFTIWLDNASGSRTLTLSIDGVAVATTTTTSNGPISMPWNSTGASGGTRTATVSVRDAVNNTGSANRTLIVPGPASLTAAINTPLEGATVSGMVTVGMSETNGTGTISWSLQLDGATPPIFSTSTAASTTTTSFNWDASGVTAGAHTLTLTVQDGGGRTATDVRHVSVTPPPPPGVTFNTPAENATVGGVVSVSVSATNVSGNLTWSVSVDDPRRPPNGTVVLFSGSGTATTISFNWDTTATIADGPHTLTATVQDGAGRTATGTRHVTVQQPPLTAFFTSPAEGAAVSGTVTVGMGENGAMGTPVSFTLTVDGGQVFNTSGAATSASFSWNTAGLSGSHQLGLTVQDAAGRTATAVRNVTVAPPPTIQVFITQPNADGATVSGTTWFTIWIQNAAAGNKTYTMSVDGTVVGTPTTTTSNGPVSMPWTTNGTPNGSHRVTISVRDSANGAGSADRIVNVAN